MRRWLAVVHSLIFSLPLSPLPSLPFLIPLLFFYLPSFPFLLPFLPPFCPPTYYYPSPLSSKKRDIFSFATTPLFQRAICIKGIEFIDLTTGFLAVLFPCSVLLILIIFQLLSCQSFYVKLLILHMLISWGCCVLSFILFLTYFKVRSNVSHMRVFWK